MSCEILNFFPDVAIDAIYMNSFYKYCKIPRKTISYYPERIISPYHRQQVKLNLRCFLARGTQSIDFFIGRIQLIINSINTHAS